MYTNKSSMTFTTTELIKVIFDEYFRHTPINAFAFSRVFNDGSRGTLSSCLELVDLMFLQNNYLESINTIKLSNASQNRYVLAPSFQPKFPNAYQRLFYEKVIEEREQLGLDNMFGVFVQHENVMDIFCFYTLTGIGYSNYCVNHLHLIENFIELFTERNSELINQACGDKVLIQDSSGFSPLATYAYLSKREMECLYWCMLGKTNPEISIILGISKETVNTHFKNIFRKLDVTSRMQAVIKALDLGLLPSSLLKRKHKF